VHSVLSHPELFSSDAMRTMFMSQKPTADPSQDAEAAERMLAIASALPFTVEEMVRARNLISTDPPEHEVMRRIVSRGFTPRRIAAYERRVHEVVRRCLDAVRDGAEFDLVRDLAVPVPTVIIAEMLGVEPERYGDFRRWSDMVISQSTGSRRGQSFSETGYVEMIRELSLYLLSIMERRRRVPADDLVTTLIAAQEGDGTLTPMEVVTFTILLLVAGNETTTNLIGNAVNVLLSRGTDRGRGIARRAAAPAANRPTGRAHRFVPDPRTAAPDASPRRLIDRAFAGSCAEERRGDGQVWP
jgi:cytochrome P450